MECPCGATSKYKCPKCKEPYCSVACFKLHKEKCEPIEPKTEKVKIRHPNRNFLLEDEDDLALTDGELEKMRGCRELVEMLKNPQLREIFADVDQSENRLGALRSVMAMDKTGDSLLTACLDLMLKSTGFLTEEGVSLL